MTNRILKCSALALGMTFAATSSMAASLGLATTGAIDTATDDLSLFEGITLFSAFPDFAIGGPSNLFFDPNDPMFSSFDQGGDVADIEAYGFVGNSLEFKLSAFDGYTDGALLSIVLQDGAMYASDPLAAILASGQSYISSANFSLQALEVAAVPVPAGALLLGTALAGFGFARKRGDKAA